MFIILGSFALLISPLPSVCLEFLADPIKIPNSTPATKEYWLVVEEAMTMGFTQPTPPFAGAYIWNLTSRNFDFRVTGTNDKCQKIVKIDDQTQQKPDSQGSLQTEKIVVADGLHKRFLAINGSLPGPTLIFVEGTEAIVHVTNQLLYDSFTIHWHGIKQKNTFWYDGVGQLTQCPIRPQETFTYRFRAEPAGTYFYHGHYGFDRGDGLTGALIILPQDNPNAIPGINGVLYVDVQFTVMLQDWYIQSTQELHTYRTWNINRTPDGEVNLTDCFLDTRTFDGTKLGEFEWRSALINGRGWNNLKNLWDEPLNLPLQTFEVKSGQNVLLRIINAGILYPYLFSVQDHDLLVVATDGHNVEPLLINYVTIYPGERYDVIPKRIPDISYRPCSRYCLIVLDTIEAYTHDFDILKERHFSLGFLKYIDMPNNQTISKPSLAFNKCSPDRVCTVLNCPFGKFADDKGISCISVQSLKSIQADKVPNSAKILEKAFEPDEFQEFFINAGKNINGFGLVYPKAPPAMFSTDELSVMTSCDTSNSTKYEYCTYHLNVTLGKVIQLVMFNRELEVEDNRKLNMFTHPMHIHGHHFFAIATGYPKYANDGLIQEFTSAIDCHEESGCNRASWTDPSWSLGRIPGSNLINPPLKDTLLVPAGGYVVIRFLADNPGWWLCHCHVLPHHLAGVAFLIREGTADQMPPKPTDFPQCFSYARVTSTAKSTNIGSMLQQSIATGDYNQPRSTTYIIAIIASFFIGIIAALVGLIGLNQIGATKIISHLTGKNHQGYRNIPASD